MVGPPIVAEYVGEVRKQGIYYASEIISLIHKYAFDYLLISWVTNDVNALK